MEMETVEGIGEETRPRASSSETGSAKQNDVAASGEKTLKENGVRVSENGEHKVADESGVIEDCVMNGVSSLLKLKQDVSDNSDAKDEDGEEEEHGYHVGDFVWGKIKNHPWWPGQIYDPSEASDLALKIKQKGKMLVAYFGDGTFAWCGASQLKPFAESFKECSNVSSSRGIVTAVEEAVEEMGRHMERLLIRDCAVELDNRVVKNAGIKEGVAVRDVRREMISSLLVGKPEGILQDVKGFAETAAAQEEAEEYC
ncbi:BnaC06g12900D [Brassica napus]|uniref:BnaC06g12900D protein n=1 Tax=Brassica napus TaxID=3708 RepID=A0A078FFB9_BRANA|nr:BnaC06g12900D [Brassica napus]